VNLLLDWLIDGAVLAAAATLAILVVPRRCSAERHALWWLALVSVLALPLVSVVSHAVSGAPSDPLRVITTPTDGPRWSAWLSPAFIGLWAVSTGVALIRLVAGLRLLRRIVAASSPLPAARRRRLTRLDTETRSRGVELRVSTAIPAACAVGFRRPCIVLGRTLIDTLDDEALEAIVLHEYAHLRRRDDWSRLLQRLLLALAGLHPAVRWICRQIDVECESACDRWAAERSGAPVVYARALAHAAGLSTRMSPILAPAAAGLGAGLRRRVLRVLDERAPDRRTRWTVSAFGVAALLAFVVAVAGLPPVVVVKAAARPLIVLTSAPVGLAWSQLPSGVVQVLDGDAPNAAAAPLTISQTAPRQAGAAAGAQVPSETQDAEATHAASAEDRNTSLPPQDAPTTAFAVSLSASDRPAPITLDQRPRSADDTADVEAVDAGIGTTMSRAGAATGAAAAHAGTALGRFFRSGGLAVARSF
jgi:beta-lactamase regulating signal transducer with metallopeptidase domain